MKFSLHRSDLADYVTAQLERTYPDKNAVKKPEIARRLARVFDRMDHCFSKVQNKYFSDGGQAVFDHLNADHYAMFLYFLSNTLYKEGADKALCSKLFLLNRCLHGVDAFYEVKLPEIFLFVHPMGTMIGRADYSDYFLVYQQCTIGSNKGTYPRLGKFVSVHPGSAVLGDCNVGDNCKISAGSVLMDQDLPANSVYAGMKHKHLVKKSADKLPIWGKK